MHRSDKIGLIGLAGALTLFVAAAVIDERRKYKYSAKVFEEIKAIWVATDAVHQRIQQGIYRPGDEDQMEYDFEYYRDNARFPDEEN